MKFVDFIANDPVWDKGFKATNNFSPTGEK